MKTKRQSIEKLEELVESELNIELSVYGVGKGYKALNEFLRGKRDYDSSVRNQAYRYWTFLNLLRIVPESQEFDGVSKILFCPESGLQSGAGPRFFVEPTLPTYSKKKLWKESSCFTYLQGPKEDDTIHDTPHLMVTRNNVDWLPWPPKRGIEIPNLSELQTLCAKGEYDQIAEKLGVNKIPSNLSDCYKIVRDLADTAEMDSKWEKFQDNAEYIINCKNGSLNKSDYTKILWYGIAYKRPLILVTSEQVSDRQFIDDLDKLPVDVSVVEEFTIDMDPSTCLNKLENIL